MKISNLYRKLWVTAAAVALFSCEVTDLNPQNSPNNPTPEQFDLDNYVNAVQVNFAEFFETGTDFGMQVTRMTAMTGGTLYDNAYTPATFDNFWEDAYSDVMVNARNLIIEADAKGATVHAAYGRILQAYTLILIVDTFGDVPYSEAFLGSANLNPNLDSSEDVYRIAVELLQEGIENLNEDSRIDDPKFDLYFSNDKAKWISLAETLKLRVFLQTRTVWGSEATDSIQDILTRNDLLTGTDGNFQFNWGNTISAPDSRHPEYGANYDNGGSTYMANYYMNLIRNDVTTAGATDPRRRYYFYRQTTTTSTNANELPCIVFNKPAHYSASDVFCSLPNGYWGRDHGDDDGIPPDGLLRTLWGIYPIGGKFDDSSGDDGEQGAGAAGAGISPIMLASFAHFLRAEAELLVNNNVAAARTQFQNGINASLSKVINFPSEVGYTMTEDDLAVVPAASNLTNYTNAILARYDAATTNSARLALIIREYYKAAFGNGFEVYNNYRRTGFPTDLQPALEANPGQFIRSFLYPANLANLNQNVDQKPFPGTQVRVFWDDGSVVLD